MLSIRSVDHSINMKVHMILAIWNRTYTVLQTVYSRTSISILVLSYMDICSKWHDVSFDNVKFHIIFWDCVRYLCIYISHKIWLGTTIHLFKMESFICKAGLCKIQSITSSIAKLVYRVQEITGNTRCTSSKRYDI